MIGSAYQCDKWEQIGGVVSLKRMEFLLKVMFFFKKRCPYVFMGLNYFLCFRWKGENVATTEVSDVIVMLDFIQEANVYGVSVPGKNFSCIF